MLKPAAVTELVNDQLFPLFQAERARLELIDRWYRWEPEELRLPRNASQEHKWLAELAKTPMLHLVVETQTQGLYVDGYRSPENRENSGPWETWQRNDFDERQAAIYDAAVAYGLCYGTSLPGSDASGKRSVLRGVSPRKMIAVYADPAEDDWPLFALRGDPSGNHWMLRVYDDEAEYRLTTENKTLADSVTFIESRIHDSGVCPVVRYAAQLDLEGRASGEVERLIPLAKRINKTVYDRLLTQHFNSWKVRTIAGIDLAPADLTPQNGETTDQAAERVARERMVVLRQSDMLTAKDADTKFGTLDETSLSGFVEAHGSDLEDLASLAQVPVTSLNGKVANLSADAISELRSGLTQKVYGYQQSFGKSHGQLLRLAASQEGNSEAADDFHARVTWQDAQVRSLSQSADALGKIATMLQVPVKALWGRIPGVTKADTDEWESMASEGDAFAQLTQMLNKPPVTG